MPPIAYSGLAEQPAIATTGDRNIYADIFSEHSSDAYNEAIDKARELVLRFLEQQKKPFSGISVATLSERFREVDFDTPLPDYDTLLNEVRDLYVDHATAFHLPAYIAHLNCPVVIPALAAEMLVSAINSSQDTWDQSAGGTLMERRLIAWTARQIGFGDEADGVFTGGGTQSNLMGLLLARDHFAQHRYGHSIKSLGNPRDAHRFRIFVSEHSHFSNQKNAALLGLGEACIVQVATDDRFRMRPDALRQAIDKELSAGNIPIAVVATAGTTDFGNIDPLAATADLCEAYNLWMHVDAAYGCGLLLTDRYRYLLDGLERAHSVTVDYHKSFFQPISSSAFIVRNHNLLRIIKHHADYLNPEEQDYEEHPSQVNKSIVQTTRRFDALKLWFTLRLLGRGQLGAYTETIIQTAKATAGLLQDDPEFELLSESDLGALVFRYRPAGYPEHSLCLLNQCIKKEMFRSGEVLVAGTKVGGRFYLKFTILNPLTTIRDIRDILHIIKKYGAASHALQ